MEKLVFKIQMKVSVDMTTCFFIVEDVIRLLHVSSRHAGATTTQSCVSCTCFTMCSSSWLLIQYFTSGVTDHMTLMDNGPRQKYETKYVK